MLSVSQRDLMVISCLRRNARETLTAMSKKTRIPVSTLFDRIRHFEQGLITKHAAIVDFARLGYSTRANIILKVNKKDREAVRDYLVKNSFVNCAYKINNGYDFMAEVIFRNMAELEDFLGILEEKFKVVDKHVYYVIDDIKKEEFLASPQLAEVLCAPQTA
jgi:Lrp/AsnC family transcriptional regulator for asnA, asnC and gidA